MIRMSFGNNRAAAGTAAERSAELWLRRQGLHSVARNFRCKLGEIDLVMRDGEQLVFVEVRLRSSAAYGGAAASVTRAKQQRIIRAAQWFLETHSRWARSPCRFDVLAASGGESADFAWQWLRNAFYVEG